MASARPLIVCIDEGSEAWKLVNRAEAGICMPPEHPERLAEAILTLRQDHNLRENFGKNGRIWAERHHSSQSAAEKFENLFSRAILSTGPK
jgi:glycosyltransferase involved in cell wall biosynthesis